ncbi:hypothetical protein ABIC12_000806 [Pantoea agglomerans]|nr:hypothetical protein KR94_02450 [Pantoea ananatis]WRH15286.1 hypothetical protein GC087_13700 [Pantoea sp. JZ2]
MGFLIVFYTKKCYWVVVVAERRADFYAENGEEAAQQLKIKKMICQMKRDRICCLITVKRGSL